MQRSRQIIGVLLFLAAAAPALQTAYAAGGSLYSILGIGDLRYSASPRAAGMGYAGIALSDSTYIGGLSPATWSTINRTRVEAGMLYEGFNSTDGITSRYLAQADFTGIVFAFPVSPAHGITLVGGFVPYSKVNYDVYTGGAYNDPLDSIGYTIHQTGNGGLNHGMAGLSYAPMQNLSVGASLNYMFGTVRTSRTMTLSSTDLAGGTINTEESFGGVTVTLGALQQDFGWLADALRPLSLGITATTRGNLHTQTQETYAFLTEADTGDAVKGRFALPMTFGVGAAYQLSEDLAVAADYASQPWASSASDIPVAGEFRNDHRFGIGLEHIAARRQDAPWLQRLTYRLGFSYNNTYVELNDHGVNEWLVTGGLDIPIGSGQSIVVGAEYGGLGRTVDRLVKDRIFRLSFSVNISEPWFIRYPGD